jgi:tetrapyrrole methylase family protein/MazG family protein
MSDRFDQLVQLMARLRAPQGCPWDRSQTHDTLKPYLLEEAYEVLETIDKRDDVKLCEELGDLLLQVLFHAQIATERKAFSIEDVLAGLAEKLVRRHPHVFGPSGDHTLTPDQVHANWEQIKKAERARAGHADSALDGVPKTLPALLRASQIQARASRVGFDWPQNGDGVHQVLEKVKEEIEELTEAYQASTQGASDPARTAAQRHLDEEMGDVLFALVNLARFLKINPEEALQRATERFSERFRFVEAEAARMGRPLASLTVSELASLWAEAKARTMAQTRTGTDLRASAWPGDTAAGRLDRCSPPDDPLTAPSGTHE